MWVFGCETRKRKYLHFDSYMRHISKLFLLYQQFKTSPKFCSDKKEKEKEFLISDNHTGAFLDVQLSPAYIFSTHLIPKAPHPPSLSLSPSPPLAPLICSSLSLSACFALLRGGGGLDSVTHRSAGAAAAFQPSPHAVCPPGLHSISHIMRWWKDEKDKRLRVIQLSAGLGCRGHVWKTQLTGFKSQFSN